MTFMTQIFAMTSIDTYGGFNCQVVKHNALKGEELISVSAETDLGYTRRNFQPIGDVNLKEIPAIRYGKLSVYACLSYAG